MDKGSMEFAGMDLGDKTSQVWVTNVEGECVYKGKVKTNVKGMREFFCDRSRMVVAIEVGTHSPWVSRLLKDLGHEVVVANAHQLRLIYRSDKKNDKRDAEMLARLARLDRKLLSPVEHRSQDESEDLALVKARAALVEARTGLINHVRGVVKSHGGRLPECSAESFPKQSRAELEAIHLTVLQPVLETIADLTVKIRKYDRKIAALSRTKYPETQLLSTVDGVGPVTAVTFRLVVGSPDRFPNRRNVGSYLGLRPRQDQSGETDKQKRITKAGDRYLRSLLVGCAHYILGRYGPDSDLRRWGLRLAERGGKNAKKRAVVAVARKLSVVLLSIWKTGKPYERLRIGAKVDQGQAA